MKKLVLIICVFALSASVMAQGPFPYIDAKAPAFGGDIINAPLVSCDNEKGTFDFPFTENGITVTGSGTGTFINYAPGWPSCGLFCKPNCIWIGYNGPATYTNTFSQPVNDMIYKLTGSDPSEIITITTNNGTPAVSYIDGLCPSSWSIAGNVITCVSYPDPNDGGAGGLFLVHSTSDFTSITFSHNGLAAGTVLTMCFDQVFNPPPPPTEVPVSDWALILGGIMIASFVFIRYRRMI